MPKLLGQVGHSPEDGLCMRRYIPYDQRYTDEVNANVDAITMISAIECQLFQIAFGDHGRRQRQYGAIQFTGKYVIVRKTSRSIDSEHT